MGKIRYQDNSLITYDEWLLLRNNSLGASEVGIVCFGSQYTSNIELFYQKVGAPKQSIENLRMYLGKVTEDISEHLWAHYDGTEQSVVDNIRKGTPVKKSINTRVTAFNDDYPHLSVTIDREIQPFGRYEGMGKGALEIKNTQSFVLNSYESGLPTANVVQLCTQIMVNEFLYGELFYFVDNRTCQCHPVKREEMKPLEELILERTIPFWDNVLKARPIYNQLYEARRSFNQRLVAECEREIASLEPPAQYTSGYNSFLSQKYKDRLSFSGIVEGTEDMYATAKKHKETAKAIAALEQSMLECEISLKNIIGSKSSISFGNRGEVSWNPNKHGKRVFLNKIK